MSVSHLAAAAASSSFSSSADFRMAKPNRLLTLLLHVLIMVVVFSVGLLFLGIAIVFVIHVFLIRRAFESSPDEDFPSFASRSSSWSSSCGLSRFDLQRLPCFDYRNGYPSDCAVCLETFRYGERCRSLPSCRHNFHAHCVDAWLAVAPVCPICRTAVRPPD
ncbi:RING-H2 finger protein ATL56-like [Nymphaea colorata]|uniref:RING-type domain-containing protein n=1 Tax=Nymphaea colorata TaxID=210225 RepID=A0A5K1CIY3_9MAGN|nr:RING-H2 finger protein ATL56-like [Nymphaea colorata]